MTQSQLPEWAALLPVTSPRPTPQHVGGNRYQVPVRDIEVRDEKIGSALIRWAFDGPTGAFDSARVFGASGWLVGRYKTEERARAAAKRVSEAQS